MARNAEFEAESKIQRNILRYLNSLDECWAIKVIVANERGIMDIFCCYKGMFVVFEVKTPTGKTTPIQYAQLGMVKAARGIAEVVRSVDEVKYIIEGIV